MGRLVAVVGATATGKSRVALRLSQEFGGEIVSADSRQVYRHMDIGTAKPSRRELALVRHRLIDIVDPDEDFSLAQYLQLASRAIDDIQRRNKLALLVGGSGLYVWAVLEGWTVPPVPPDLEFRRSLAEQAATRGADEVYQQLMRVDPAAARRIDPRNVRRVIRALEVQRHAATPFSQLQHKKAPSFDALIIGLTADRPELYRRIDLRVDDMVKQGLVEEVKRLASMGYGFHLPAMSGVGYRQIGMYLRDEVTLAAAIQEIKYETHRIARHQYGWFRLADARIRWFDIQGEVESEVGAEVAGFMSGNSA